MTTRADVDYLLQGLEQELRDGLARLERADQADDHVAWYRRAYDDYVASLRQELDSPTPDIHEIAVAAMQAAWLARIWPVLQAARLQWRAPDNLKRRNTSKQTAAAQKQARCLAIAETLTRPTPKTIRARYIEQFSGPAPALRTIRTYLTPK